MKNSLPSLELLQKANLTFRELEVLEQVKKGLTCKEISENLSIGIETVKTHRKNIMSKLCLVGKTSFRKFILDLLIAEIPFLHISNPQVESPQNHP